MRHTVSVKISCDFDFLCITFYHVYIWMLLKSRRSIFCSENVLTIGVYVFMSRMTMNCRLETRLFNPKNNKYVLVHYETFCVQVRMIDDETGKN